MSNTVNIDGGTAASTQIAQDQETATPSAAGQTSAMPLDKAAQKAAEELALQKLFEAAAKIITEAAGQKGEAGSKSSTAPGLPNLAVPTGPLDFDMLLKVLAFESRRQACKDGVQNLEIRSEEQKKLGLEQLDELKKQIAAMEKKDFWGGVLKVFQWIGAVIGVIAAVATLAAGVASGNPALIISGVIASIMAVESIVSLATDGKYSLLNGITELCKLCGLSEDVSKIVGMAVQLAIMVASIAVSVGTAIKQAGTKVAEISSKVAEQVFNVVMKSQLVLNIVSVPLAVAQGSLGIVNAVYQNQADKTKANTKELEAIMERVRTAFENEQALLKSEMERVSSLLEKVAQMVKDYGRAQSKIVSTAPAMA